MTKEVEIVTEEDSCTVTVTFKNEKQRRKWLTETISKDGPFSFSCPKSLAKNINLDLSSLCKDTTEDTVQLQLPFDEDTTRNIPTGVIPNCS